MMKDMVCINCSIMQNRIKFNLKAFPKFTFTLEFLHIQATDFPQVSMKQHLTDLRLEVGILGLSGSVF